jgi:hypothetical protein
MSELEHLADELDHAVRWSPPCFLSDISGWSLSLVGAAPRRHATERPAGAACWPPSPIPFSRMPDRGDAGAVGGALRGRRAQHPDRDRTEMDICRHSRAPAQNRMGRRTKPPADLAVLEN